MSNKNKNKNQKEQHTKETLGSLLSKARNSSELSVQYIAEQLKLSVELVEALEKDDIEKLPAPIFVRGYIRNYAAMVNLPESRVIDCFNEMIGSDPIASLSTVRLNDTAVDSDSKWRRMLPFAIVIMLVLLVVIVWLSSETTPEPVTETDNDRVEVVGEKLPADKEGDLVLPVEPESAPVIEQSKTSPANTAVAEPVKVPKVDKVVAEKVVVEQPKSVDVVDARESLMFDFSAESWTDVSDANGKRLIFKMVRAGEKISVSGIPPFKILLGNARAASLSRDGEVVDLLPFIRGNVAKFSLSKRN